MKDLSLRLGKLRPHLEISVSLAVEADTFFARAEYGYSLKGVKPALNEKGVVEIEKGRHPLLERERAVPVTVSVGKSCRFLLISGANTGGKTVSSSPRRRGRYSRRARSSPTWATANPSRKTSRRSPRTS